MKSNPFAKKSVGKDGKPIERNYPENPLLKVDIHEVLNVLGAEDRGGGKWKIPNMGIMIVKPGTQAFMLTFDGDRPGGGAINLVRFIFDLDFKGALNWMKENIGPDPLMVDDNGMQIGENKYFTPPPSYNANRDAIKTYLTETRGLPTKLIDRLMKEGSIYADKKKRCVFLSDSGAELRSAYDGEFSFKGGATGNDTSLNDFGFQVEADANAIRHALAERQQAPAVAVAEAAITALSYHTLNPHTVVLSSNGSGRFNLHFSAALDTYYNDDLPFQMPFNMATDADDAGDFAAQRLWNALYLRERLSAGLNIDMEVVDQWISNGDIHIDLRSDVVMPNGEIRRMMVASPHTCFFGLDLINPNEFPDDFSVYTLDGSKIREMSDTDEESKEKEKDKDKENIIIDTGRKMPPVISFTVKEGLHPKLNRREYRDIPIDKVNYAKMDWCFRARPKLGVDWNDDLKAIGQKAIHEYVRKTSPLIQAPKKTKVSGTKP